jgi:hypothetical protein
MLPNKRTSHEASSKLSSASSSGASCSGENKGMKRKLDSDAGDDDVDNGFDTITIDDSADDPSAPSLEEMMLRIAEEDSRSSSSSRKVEPSRQNFYGPTVRTFIPRSDNDPNTARKIAQIVVDHFTECKKKDRPVVMSDHPDLFFSWPAVPITIRQGGVAAANREKLENEQKIFAIKFPSLHSEESHPTFFLYKKGMSNSPLRLSHEAMQELLKVVPSIFTYLRGIEGTPFNLDDGLLNLPEARLLENVDAKRKIYVHVDQINSAGQIYNNRACPTVSIREQKLWEDGVWRMSAVGVTLTASNFYFFMKATVGQFYPSIEKLTRDFKFCFNTLKSEHELALSTLST